MPKFYATVVLGFIHEAPTEQDVIDLIDEGLELRDMPEGVMVEVTVEPLISDAEAA